MFRAARNATIHPAGEHGGDVHVDSDGFRLLGMGFSRLDAFSDVVFGFALTLLVVSLEVPRSYAELHHLLRGFVPFAISFLLLMLVWYGHFVFFRRFGTHDAGTIWLNGLLLFVVLFYVYPLKFLFLTMMAGAVEFGDVRQVRELVLLFSGGLGVIYLLFSALYANAYRQRVKLGLTAAEAKLTRISVVEEFGVFVIAGAVCSLAALLAPQNSPLACWAFMLIGPWKWWMGARAGKVGRSAIAAKQAGPYIADDVAGPASIKVE